MWRNPVVMSPDKPGVGLGSNSIGRRYRTPGKPREHQLSKPRFSSTGSGSTDDGNGLMTIGGSGGVMAVARREGMHRDWRGPPCPEEKDPGKR